jgi:hypothetical protein
MLYDDYTSAMWRHVIGKEEPVGESLRSRAVLYVNDKLSLIFIYLFIFVFCLVLSVMSLRYSVDGRTQLINKTKY